MDYRSFLAQRAHAGDLAAQRVLEQLKAPPRNRHEQATEPLASVTLEQIRERLKVIRAAEEARCERARVERANLTRVDKPPTIEQALASARKEIQAHVSEATQFTQAERAALARLTKEQQSWNPFARNAAKKEAAKLHEGQHARYEAELAKAMRDFESGDAPRIQERIRGDARTYRDYVRASLGLEDQMRKARAVLREDVPKIEKQLTVLERTGVAQVQCDGTVWGAGLDKLATAVQRSYREVPEAVRRDVEFGIRREQQALARVRDAISMDR